MLPDLGISRLSREVLSGCSTRELVRGCPEAAGLDRFAILSGPGDGEAVAGDGLSL